MYRLTITFLLAFLVNGFAAENETAFLKFKKEAVLEKKVPGCNVYDIPFDGEIYKSVSPGFTDIRVTDSAGSIVPFKLSKAVERKDDYRYLPRPSSILSMSKNKKDNRIEIIVENKTSEQAISLLRINLSDKNFEKTVTVFSSNDRKNWTLNTKDVKIFDYSKIIDLSSNEVNITPANSKYFKVVIDNFTEKEKSAFSKRSVLFENGKVSSETITDSELNKSLRIDSIELLYAQKYFYDSTPQLAAHPVSVKSIENKDKQTIVTVETDRQPLTSFTVLSDTPGFVRQAWVEVPAEDKAYASLAYAKIFSANIPDGEMSMTKLAFGERRNREYRIRIFNAENSPLDNIRIKAEGPQYQITVLADAGAGPFYICYGGELEAPQYDVGEVLGMLDNQIPASLSLDKEEINPDYKKAPFADSGLLGKYLFYGGMGIMVLLLGITLAFYLRKIETSSSEDLE